jgi:cell division protein FtsL
MKLNLLLIPTLVLALLASCLLLVKTSYESRQVFAQLDAARAEQRQLDAEYKRLDAEAQAQGTHLRVERTAREKLQMRTATPAVTAYVVDAQAPATAPAAGSRAPGAAP